MLSEISRRSSAHTRYGQWLNAKVTNWLRFALKCGLLATDASVWAAMHHLLNEGSENMQSAFDRADRLGEERGSQQRTGLTVQPCSWELG